MNTVSMLDLSKEYQYMKQDIDAALGKCLAHQKWIFGPEIGEFEAAVAEYLGVPHCIGVSSGTEALVLSLRAQALQRKGEEFFAPEDEILTTPFTFTATGDAILRSGATPVFVDIDPVTFNIDAHAVSEYLASPAGSRVVGIIPVHLYGRPAPIEEIAAIAQRRGLFVVEDVAQAFGASRGGRKLGAFGTTGAFSFFPSKNLGSFGDAGMVSTAEAKTAELVRMLLKHGGKDKYNVDHIGYNGRMDTLQAAVLIAKLRYIDEFNSRRQATAKLYGEMLETGDDLVLPDVPGSASEDTHVFHQYTVRTKRRDSLQSFLKDRGVSTMVYYPVPLHLMKVFKGRMKIAGSLENSERAAAEVLSLPIGPLQEERETRYVAACVAEYFETLRTNERRALPAEVR